MVMHMFYRMSMRQNEHIASLSCQIVMVKYGACHLAAICPGHALSIATAAMIGALREPRVTRSKLKDMFQFLSPDLSEG